MKDQIKDIHVNVAVITLSLERKRILRGISVPFVFGRMMFLGQIFIHIAGRIT